MRIFPWVLVIEGLKKELERCRGDRFVHVFQELMPIRSRCEEEGGAKLEAHCKDKKNWMSSAQLWRDYSSDDIWNDDDQSVADERDGGPDGQEDKENLCVESRSGADTSVPFKGMAALVMSSKQEVTPTAILSDLSLRSPADKSVSFPFSGVAGNHPGSGSVSKCVGRAPPSTAGAHLSLQLQQQRKARRCWSPELHRRFVLALQQLGGAQGQIGFLSYLKYVEIGFDDSMDGKKIRFFRSTMDFVVGRERGKWKQISEIDHLILATPKQIRELMKVDGLTNDEVKSHLQKSVSLSGSPQSPLQLADARRAVSPTAGDSCEEEDGKSECHTWRLRSR
ncbi:hypothetical protein GW17_00038369 [Ensete ventricosum]|nr:hypothetical protein GW17_00038369 [Ensete ventricosum]